MRTGAEGPSTLPRTSYGCAKLGFATPEKLAEPQPWRRAAKEAVENNKIYEADVGKAAEDDIFCTAEFEAADDDLCSCEGMRVSLHCG